MEKTIEERLTERDRFANDVKSCCADLADTFCGDNSCVTCITDSLMKLGYRRASDILNEVVEACFIRGDDEYIEISRDDWEALEKKYGNESWCKESESEDD